MKVIAPYTEMHPLADDALTRFAPTAERVKVEGDEGYWELLCGLWAKAEDFLIVEQDIELNEQSIPYLEACGYPWCVVPYTGPVHVKGWAQDDQHYLVRSLGCTRFSHWLMQSLPGLLTTFKPEDRHWAALDLKLFSALQGWNHHPHIHFPPVLQHHVWKERCCCGQAHKEYPTDSEGRYRAPARTT